MKSKLLDETGGRRTYVLVFDIDDEVVPVLESFADDNKLRGSHFTGIGALRRVTVGWWSWEERDYHRIELDEQVEVLTLAGNIAAAPDGSARVHAHLVVGRSDGTAHGGHLLEAVVRPTLEIVVSESPSHLQRQHDDVTGLALIRP